jgi:hypothetical protein
VSALDPAVRELLTAVRAALYAPYLEQASVGDAVVTTRAVLAAVLFDSASLEVATEVLVESTAEAADAGRCRYYDRLGR